MTAPLRLLFACVFVVMIGYGITITVLPYYTERIHGLRGIDEGSISFHVGLLTSVYAFAQLVASPVVGRIGDRVGRRPVLLVGLGGMAATQIVFGFTTQLWGLYLLRGLGGLAASGMLVASTTYVADATSEDDRSRGMAWFGTAVSLGLVAGPALGGVLSRPGLSLGTGTLRLDGLSLPFVVAGLLALAVLVAAMRRLPESLPDAGGARRGRDRSVTPVHAAPRPGLRSLLGVAVASQFGLALFESTFVLYARDRLALGPTRASVAFMVCGLVMALFQVIAVGALAKVVHPVLQVSAGLALMGAGIAALVTTTDFALALVFIGVLALGTALVTPNLSALISSRSEHRSISTALGLKSAAGSVGQFSGPLAGGVMLGWQPNSPFLLSGALLVVIGFAVGLAHHVPATTTADERE